MARTPVRKFAASLKQSRHQHRLEQEGKNILSRVVGISGNNVCSRDSIAAIYMLIFERSAAACQKEKEA
ncbi:hypothetical protein Q8A67_017855 [Cirrhinus molitorella]|uniref:Uncharacterized protein n=1 Tax=Cirrhinus molitorella TaxID=172907 RepID=A0AA88PBU9_9TELE|nr:hypothetical protein Q8A67_017855 [Cirrhinus molitorella]